MNDQPSDIETRSVTGAVELKAGRLPVRNGWVWSSEYTYSPMDGSTIWNVEDGWATLVDDATLSIKQCRRAGRVVSETVAIHTPRGTEFFSRSSFASMFSVTSSEGDWHLKTADEEALAEAEFGAAMDAWSALVDARELEMEDAVRQAKERVAEKYSSSISAAADECVRLRRVRDDE